MTFPNGRISSNSVNLTPRQKHAIPLILAARTVEEGCRSAGINKQTWYNWIKDERFKEEVSSRREAAISDALDRLKAAVTSAVEGMTALVDSEDEGLRLKACGRVLDYMMKMKEMEEMEHRLAALERVIGHRAV